MKSQREMTAMKTLSRSVAYSLGAHGVALAVLVLANAHHLAPGPTLETVPFIHASLIYAMNGQADQKAPSLPRKKETVTPVVRAVHKPAENPPPSHQAINKTVPEAALAPEAGSQRAKEGGAAEAAVSLHLPSPGGAGIGQIASLGAAAETRFRDGRSDGSAGTDAVRMLPPRYLKASRPAYPILARMRGYEGMVLLAVEVMADGRPGEIRVKKSSGYALLDESALNAVQRWRFEPARRMNTPLAMTVEVPVRFYLKETD
jgi:protein TonB